MAFILSFLCAFHGVRPASLVCYKGNKTYVSLEYNFYFSVSVSASVDVLFDSVVLTTVNNDLVDVQVYNGVCSVDSGEIYSRDRNPRDVLVFYKESRVHFDAIFLGFSNLSWVSQPYYYCKTFFKIYN